MKIFLTTILLTIISAINVFSQSGIGINSTGTDPDATAGLDVSYPDKGVLIPRVALTQTTSNSPIGAGIVTSLMIYNTATVNDVNPGYYYWDGGKWVQLLTSSQGCTSCTTSGWTLVGALNSTVAGVGGWIGGNYTYTAGKEVVATIVRSASDVTATTADAVALIEYTTGEYLAGGGSDYFFVSCPIATKSKTDSARILGRKTGAGTSPAIITASGFGGGAPASGIGLSADGKVWLWDNSNTTDVAIYIFER